MIPFKYGTQKQYDEQVKDNSALYFISDTKRIYRGEELISGVQALVVQQLPEFKYAIEGIIYVLLDDDTATMYVKGDTDFVSISGTVGGGSIQNIKAFASGMVVTSKDGIDSVNDNQIMTASAVKNAVDNATGVWEYLDEIPETSKIYG